MKSIVHAVCVGYICVTSVGVLGKCQMVWHRVENYVVFIVLTGIQKTHWDTYLPECRSTPDKRRHLRLACAL